jgi:hypothetical protein
MKPRRGFKDSELPKDERTKTMADEFEGIDYRRYLSVLIKEKPLVFFRGGEWVVLWRSGGWNGGWHVDRLDSPRGML